MGKPNHFRAKDKNRCCSKCRFKRLNKKTYVRECVKHVFELPEEVYELATHECDDFEPIDEE